jgi:hypothetical protein
VGTDDGSKVGEGNGTIVGMFEIVGARDGTVVGV